MQNLASAEDPAEKILSMEYHTFKAFPTIMVYQPLQVIHGRPSDSWSCCIKSKLGSGNAPLFSKNLIWSKSWVMTESVQRFCYLVPCKLGGNLYQVLAEGLTQFRIVH